MPQVEREGGRQREPEHQLEWLNELAVTDDRAKRWQRLKDGADEHRHPRNAP